MQSLDVNKCMNTNNKNGQRNQKSIESEYLRNMSDQRMFATIKVMIIVRIKIKLWYAVDNITNAIVDDKMNFAGHLRTRIIETWLASIYLWLGLHVSVRRY